MSLAMSLSDPPRLNGASVCANSHIHNTIQNTANQHTSTKSSSTTSSSRSSCSHLLFSPLRSSLLTLIFLLHLLTFSACCPSPDVWPARKNVAVSDTSYFYAYVLQGQVILQSSNFPTQTYNSFDESTGSTTLQRIVQLPSLSCRDITVPHQHFNADATVQTDDAWATWIDLASNVLAVGSPNNDLQLYWSDWQYSYSVFYNTTDANNNTVIVEDVQTVTFQQPLYDILPYDSSTPLNPHYLSYSSIVLVLLGPSGVLSNQTIEDYNTPWLGAVFSMKPDAQQLAAAYNAHTVAVYAPVKSRHFKFWNTEFDDDRHILLGDDFFIESIHYRSNTIAVAGFHHITHSCIPTLLLYDFDSSSDSWQLRGSYRLTRHLPVDDLSNTLECPNHLPTNALPVKLSDDARWVSVGVPAWSVVFLADTEDVVTTLSFMYTSASNLNAISTSSTVHSFNIGHEIEFSTANGDILSVLCTNNLLYNIPRSVFLQYSRLPLYASVDLNSADMENMIINSYVLPHRKQQRTSRRFLQFAASPSLILIYLDTDPTIITSSFFTSANTPFSSTSDIFPILPLPSALPGYEFNVYRQVFIKCPAGTYRDSAPTHTFENKLPCSYCPAQSFSARIGQTACTSCDLVQYYITKTSLPTETNVDIPDESVATVSVGDLSSYLSPDYPYNPLYCPLGTFYPLNVDSLDNEPNNFLPNFQAENARDNFEDLLVNHIFTRTSQPMYVLYILMFIVLFMLLIYSLPCSPQVHRGILACLSCFRYFQVPSQERVDRDYLDKRLRVHLAEDDEMKHQTRLMQIAAAQVDRPTKKRVKLNNDLEEEAEGEWESLRPAAISEEDWEKLRPSYIPMKVAAVEKLLIMKTIQASSGSVAELEDSPYGLHLDLRILRGFFNLMLLLFCLAALLYGSIYFNSYDAFKHRKPNDSPINRFSWEELNSFEKADDYYARAIDQLQYVPVTIRMDLHGLSGPSCVPNTLLGVDITGCKIVDSVLPCNSSQFYSIFPSNNGSVCTIQLKLPNNTLFAEATRISLFFPPTTHVLAIDYHYYQDEHLASPDDQSNYLLGSTNFHELVLHPHSGFLYDRVYSTNNATTNATYPLLPSTWSAPRDNYLAPLITRTWQLGTLVFRYQDNIESPPHFFARVHRTIDSLDPPLFPAYSRQNYQLNPVPFVEFRIDMMVTQFWRSQSVERLIQPNMSFLALVICIIGIFFFIQFVHFLVELIWFMIKRCNVCAHWLAHKTSRIGAVQREPPPGYMAEYVKRKAFYDQKKKEYQEAKDKEIAAQGNNKKEETAIDIEKASNDNVPPPFPPSDKFVASITKRGVSNQVADINDLTPPSSSFTSPHFPNGHSPSSSAAQLPPPARGNAAASRQNKLPIVVVDNGHSHANNKYPPSAAPMPPYASTFNNVSYPPPPQAHRPSRDFDQPVGDTGEEDMNSNYFSNSYADNPAPLSNSAAPVARFNSLPPPHPPPRSSNPYQVPFPPQYPLAPPPSSSPNDSNPSHVYYDSTYFQGSHPPSKKSTLPTVQPPSRFEPPRQPPQNNSQAFPSNYNSNYSAPPPPEPSTQYQSTARPRTPPSVNNSYLYSSTPSTYHPPINSSNPVSDSMYMPADRSPSPSPQPSHTQRMLEQLAETQRQLAKQADNNNNQNGVGNDAPSQSVMFSPTSDMRVKDVETIPEAPESKEESLMRMDESVNVRGGPQSTRSMHHHDSLLPEDFSDLQVPMEAISYPNLVAMVTPPRSVDASQSGSREHSPLTFNDQPEHTMFHASPPSTQQQQPPLPQQQVHEPYQSAAPIMSSSPQHDVRNMSSPRSKSHQLDRSPQSPFHSDRSLAPSSYSQPAQSSPPSQAPVYSAPAAPPQPTPAPAPAPASSSQPQQLPNDANNMDVKKQPSVDTAPKETQPPNQPLAPARVSAPSTIKQKSVESVDNSDAPPSSGSFKPVRAPSPLYPQHRPAALRLSSLSLYPPKANPLALIATGAATARLPTTNANQQQQPNVATANPSLAQAKNNNNNSNNTSNSVEPAASSSVPRPYTASSSLWPEQRVTLLGPKSRGARFGRLRDDDSPRAPDAPLVPGHAWGEHSNQDY